MYNYCCDIQFMRDEERKIDFEVREGWRGTN